MNILDEEHKPIRIAHVQHEGNVFERLEYSNGEITWAIKKWINSFEWKYEPVTDSKVLSLENIYREELNGLSKLSKGHELVANYLLSNPIESNFSLSPEAQIRELKTIIDKQTELINSLKGDKALLTATIEVVRTQLVQHWRNIDHKNEQKVFLGAIIDQLDNVLNSQK